MQQQTADFDSSLETGIPVPVPVWDFQTGTGTGQECLTGSNSALSRFHFFVVGT